MRGGRLREGSGDIYFERAIDYCRDESQRLRIEQAIKHPDSVVTRPGKKLKIDAGGADKRFMKDKFSVYIDGER